MQDYSENTTRLAKNTVMLYIRMLFSIIVSLFTTRVVLDTLGASDYGISNVVGGVVSMMGVVTSLLSQGTSRFITIALGQNNEEELKKTFSASITIHLVLSVIILVIGEAIGPLLIGRLNIAEDRMVAAQFVYQFSLITSLVGIMQSPYHASIIAHERMDVFAYISIWDVLAKLGIVYVLILLDADKLILYSLLLLVVGVISSMMYVLYCRKHFQECCNIVIRPDKTLYRAIFRYTGWNAIGSVAFTLNGQGMTILLSAFGTAVNAARGIAGSVSGVVYRFVDSFQSAARPQIVKLCAAQDFEGMNVLIMRVSKYSSYLMGIIGIPLFLEMEYVLQLWLKDVPDYTVIFARLTLIQGLIQSMDFPIGAGIHAVGKMKLPNITSAFIYMMILPLSYLAIRTGASPVITYILAVCVYPMAMFMDLYIIHKYTSFRPFKFLKEIVIRSVIFIIITALIAKCCVCDVMPVSFGRLLCTIGVSVTFFLMIVLMFGMSKGEKMFIKKFLSRKGHKVTNV